MFDSFALSDVGRVRQTNQDSGYAGAFLLVVADGMGGHAGGDVASRIAVSHLAQLDREFTSISEAKRELKKHVLRANQLILNVVVEYPQLAGLGTTLSAVVRVGSTAVIAHIGDSRVYRVRDSRIQQLTKDHTFVQQLIDGGRITAAEATVHPRRSVLMRVLGDVDARPELDLIEADIDSADTWLVCSDGLTGVMADADILARVARKGALSQRARGLLSQSLDLGAPDNVTLVIAQPLPTSLGSSVDDSSPVPRGTFVGSATGDDPLNNLLQTSSPNRVSRSRVSSPLPVSTDGIPVILDEADAADTSDDGSASTGNSQSDVLRRFFSSQRSRVILAIIVGVVVISAAVALVLVTTHGGGPTG